MKEDGTAKGKKAAPNFFRKFFKPPLQQTNGVIYYVRWRDGRWLMNLQVATSPSMGNLNFDNWIWMTMPSNGHAIRKDYACLDESPSGDSEWTRGLKSGVLTIWPMWHGQSHHGRTVMHRTFNSGDGSATLPGVTTFKKWRRPLYKWGEKMYNVSESSLTKEKRKWRKDCSTTLDGTSCASQPLEETLDENLGSRANDSTISRLRVRLEVKVTSPISWSRKARWAQFPHPLPISWHDKIEEMNASAGM